MTQNLKFSHKILLAASLVVIAAFSLFTLYNDYLQRNAIRTDLEHELESLGQVTASNIQNWLSGRILLVESVAQSVDDTTTPESLAKTLESRVLTSTFDYTYLGSVDGVMTMRPADDLGPDYDPRTRPWYKDAMSAGGSTLTEPYIDASTSQLIITIATPAGGNGVVGGDLSLETLVQIVNSLDFGGMGYAFLVSSDGKILVHPDKDLVMKSLKEVYPQAPRKSAVASVKLSSTVLPACSPSPRSRACLRSTGTSACPSTRKRPTPLSANSAPRPSLPQ